MIGSCGRTALPHRRQLRPRACGRHSQHAIYLLGTRGQAPTPRSAQMAMKVSVRGLTRVITRKRILPQSSVGCGEVCLECLTIGCHPIGMISCISTGIQTGIPWRTIKLQPSADDPPDWLLLDLFAIPYNSIANIGTIPDPVPVPITLMNSTPGKININAAVFLNSTTTRTTLRSAPIQGTFSQQL